MELNMDETLEMGARDRNNVSNNTYKTGFREGASAGKELTFQESFNEGFQKGFRSGVLLGKYQGSITLLESNQIKTLHTDEFNIEHKIERPSRGYCSICRNQNLNKSISEISIEQDTEVSKYLKYLFDTYSWIGNKLYTDVAKSIDDNIL